jgi:peptidoglycan/LPS O-acetylase OafA/YrhL
VPPRAHAPEPAVAPPPGNPRFPLFDGLRAVAALSIVVTHASGITSFNTVNDPFGAITARLNAGVAVFFVISGFLLYRPFVAARLEGSERPSAGRFWWRRALRILPAYWVALAVLSIWPGLTLPASDVWRHVLLVQNLDTRTLAEGIGPAWSLCIEAEFYLALPFLALAADRLFARRRHALRDELLVIGALARVALAVRPIGPADSAAHPYQTTMPGMFLWFAPGMAMAVVSAHWHASGWPRWGAWLGERAALCWVAAFVVLVLTTQIGLPRGLDFRYSDRTWFGEHVLYATFAALIVMPAVVGDGRRGLPQRLLGTRLMAWLGLVSYGVFLYHLPPMPKFLDVQNHAVISPFATYTVVIAAVAIAFGTLSYYLVERPVLRLKDVRRRPRPDARPAPEPAP